MSVSRQRALIALKSHPSVKAAARSIPCDPSTLLRLTVGDPELATAYENCVSGVIHQRGEEERAAAKREREAAKPRVTERAAEKRKARFFAATGRNPRMAAAALHKRLNHERRQEKMADLEAAIDACDQLLAGSKDVLPLPRALKAWDRWCATCKTHVLENPCENCNRYTTEVK